MEKAYTPVYYIWNMHKWKLVCKTIFLHVLVSPPIRGYGTTQAVLNIVLSEHLLMQE